MFRQSSDSFDTGCKASTLPVRLPRLSLSSPSSARRELASFFPWMEAVTMLIQRRNTKRMGLCVYIVPCWQQCFSWTASLTTWTASAIAFNRLRPPSAGASAIVYKCLHLSTIICHYPPLYAIVCHRLSASFLPLPLTSRTRSSYFPPKRLWHDDERPLPFPPRRMAPFRWK